MISVSSAQETPEATPEATEEGAKPTATSQQDLSTAVPPLTENIPPEVANHADDWPLANKDYSNTRADTTSLINSTTVNRLEVAWTFPIPGRANYGAAASAPVIMAGTVYFQDLESNVFAIDLHSGREIWQKAYSNPVIGPNGPGVAYGKVFVISGVDTFAALDVNTGQEVWSINTGAFQPYPYGGYVFYTTQAGVGGEGDETFRGYAGGTSGRILAINPETGETVWEFQTVEEDFWGNPEVNSGGGVWFPPAIDTLTGLTFWGTGNPAPFPGTFEFPNASSRQEPNLYSNSLVALQHDTGDLIWYNYVNPNDLFDLDFQLSPILATVQIAGQPRDIVIGSGKMGHIIAMDRQTGAIISK
jgi:glucose dehydrogenase